VKVAISLPDAVFDAAERLAGELHIPRSQLYAQALEAFVVQHSGVAVTERLNRVHADAAHRLDPALTRAQAAVLDDEAW
jgi:predicted transcriptional regulator